MNLTFLASTVSNLNSTISPVTLSLATSPTNLYSDSSESATNIFATLG